ncbi:putative shewanella-like protein phosphatase 2 [Cocos nucifera]|nr:putative shewanella-like protein phosphatase 2 [Cocos nucifera]
MELEERKKLQTIEVELTSTKEKVKLAQEALNQVREQAIKDYQSSEDFKNAILKGGSISYWTGYEDDWDMVGKFYPDLDLSCITIPGANEEDEPTEAVSTLGEEEAPLSQSSLHPLSRLLRC